MRNLFLAGLLFIITITSSAQSGRITGKVIHASSGQALFGATLTLIDKSKQAIADQNGDFTFNKLAPGVYSVKCSYSGYDEKTVDSIVVKKDDNTAITISLEEKKESLSEVRVVATPRTKAAGETEASLLIAQKNLGSVSDGITAQKIRQAPNNTTSDVIKRVSGASIQDDRFAVIRGLNDRYNAAFINGAPLPSTESDRKAFAFDIFPSSILDNLVIYKTATPDKNGEFAGGIIDITTKSILPKSFTSISFGSSYNSLLTGDTRYFSENKGKKDWIGIDDGTRGIPAGIPSVKDIRTASFAQKAEYAKLFGNYKWGIKKGVAKPNYNFQLSKGFNVLKNDQEFLGVLFSVNYNRNFTFNTGDRNGFDPPDYTVPVFVVPPQRGKYKDSVYNDEVVVAALANISVKIDGRNNLSWKNNFSTNTDNKLIKRIGAPDFTNDSTSFSKEAVRWFTSNQIFSSQLTGEHLVGHIKTKVNWLASYSQVKREIPNLSRTQYSGMLPDFIHLSASIVEPPSQTNGSGTMFFSESDENIKSFKADITQPYKFMKNSQNFIKAGGGYQIRKREFTSRVLGFTPYNDNNGTVFDNSLKSLPEDQLYLRQHLGKLKNGMGGFILSDGTLGNSDYDASSTLTSGYVMNDQRFFKKFRLVYGARVERFNQKLNSIKDNRTININTVITDVLPSANFVYSFTSKTNFRLSYSRTINRPEFRELAPFLFFEYQTNFLMEGNPGMKRALVDNFDFRYEFFPGDAQLFSVSAFYKDFTNPIELVSLPRTSSQTYYQNAISAKVYGLEAEFRTLVSTIFGDKKENSFLSKLTLSMNAAYIKSNVILDSIGPIPASELATDRALQGQSPYIVNGSLGFNDNTIGLSSTVSVNRVGDRIFIAGTYNTADLYEMARTVMDFQIAKYFLKNALEIKFTAKDILAQNINFYYDFDRSKSFSDNDRYFSSYIAPKTFSLSASLKF